MNKEEFVETLNLPYEGEMWGNEYVITLNSSDEFSDLYNIISNNKDLSMEDNSLTTTNNAMFVFFNDDFDLRLTADFEKDIYKLTIGDR